MDEFSSCLRETRDMKLATTTVHADDTSSGAARHLPLEGKA